MGKVKLTDRHKQWISAAMFALAVLLLLDAVFQVGMHARWRHWIPATLAAGTATSQPTDTQPADTQPADTQPADTQPAAEVKPSQPAKPAAVHAAIKKRNIMTKPVPKGHGMKLTGVLGKIALFTTRDGKTVGLEEGKSAHGIKVTAVEGYVVTIEYGGKTDTMKLFADKKGPGPSAALPAGPPAPGAKPTGDEATPQSKPAEMTGEKVPSSQPRGATP